VISVVDIHSRNLQYIKICMKAHCTVTMSEARVTTVARIVYTFFALVATCGNGHFDDDARSKDKVEM